MASAAGVKDGRSLHVLHVDTQGQSEPIFALAYLLGIELMPRIRNWKELDLWRPDRHSRYEHRLALYRNRRGVWGATEQ